MEWMSKSLNEWIKINSGIVWRRLIWQDRDDQHA